MLEPWSHCATFRGPQPPSIPQGGGGACGHTVLPFSPTHSHRGAGGRKNHRPHPPIPQKGGGVVRSHCATFLTEHDLWGGGGGAGGAKEAWNIYIYIYMVPPKTHTKIISRSLQYFCVIFTPFSGTQHFSISLCPVTVVAQKKRFKALLDPGFKIQDSQDSRS